MSYTNPSRIINKTAQEVQKGGQRMQDQLLTTSAEIAKASQIQKKQLAQLEEENIERENNFFDSVQNSTKGHQHLDSKVANTFEGLTKDYVEINRLAALGPPEGISKTEANLRRREIEQTPKQFQEQAGYLEIEVQKYGDALKNGTMSSIGSPTNKAVLDAMYNDRDVEIARENGEFFYYIPKKDKDGKNLPWPENEGSLNGTKLAERSQSGEDLFDLKTDTGGLTKTIWDKLSGEETGLGEYTITKSFENGDIHPTSGKPIEGLEDGYVQVIQMPNTGKKQNFIEEVEASGMLDGMLGDQKAMLSVWQDNIADGEEQEDGTYPPNTLGSFAQPGNELDIDLDAMGLTMEEWQNSAYGEYPTDITEEQKTLIQTNQAKAAKRYLANNSWDENSLSPGASKTIGKRKKPDQKIDSPDVKNTGKPTKSLWELSKNNLKARENFEEVRAKKEDITSKFKFLPQVIDANAIEKVEAEMGFDEGSFSDQEGRSKEEFEKFLLEQIGVDANFLQLEEGYNKEQGINNKTTTTKVNKPATTNAAGGNNRLKS
jgi:hypothetical protein